MVIVCYAFDIHLIKCEKSHPRLEHQSLECKIKVTCWSKTKNQSTINGCPGLHSGKL